MIFLHNKNFSCPGQVTSHRLQFIWGVKLICSKLSSNVWVGAATYFTLLAHKTFSLHNPCYLSCVIWNYFCRERTRKKVSLIGTLFDASFVCANLLSLIVAPTQERSDLIGHQWSAHPFGWWVSIEHVTKFYVGISSKTKVCFRLFLSNFDIHFIK